MRVSLPNGDHRYYTCYCELEAALGTGGEPARCLPNGDSYTWRTGDPVPRFGISDQATGAPWD